MPLATKANGSRLLELPTELRDLICEFVLASPITVDLFKDKDGAAALDIAISRARALSITCATLREDCAGITLEQTPILISIPVFTIPEDVALQSRYAPLLLNLYRILRSETLKDRSATLYLGRASYLKGRWGLTHLEYNWIQVKKALEDEIGPDWTSRFNVSFDVSFGLHRVARFEARFDDANKVTESLLKGYLSSGDALILSTDESEWMASLAGLMAECKTGA